MVYFIQEDTKDGFIKIGQTSGELVGKDNRLQVLSQGNPHGFKIIASVPGGRDLEKQIHKDLHAANFRGEWFFPFPEVFDYIQKIPNVQMGSSDERDIW